MTPSPTPGPSTSRQELDLDGELLAVLGTPEGRADPYPHYARMREHEPVFRSSIGSWIVTRFEDCQQVLRSPQFGKGADQDATARERLARWGVPAEEAADFRAFFERRQSMLTLNPPDHTRLRGLVARAFTPNTVEALRPHVVALCDGLLDTVADRASGGKPVDVMHELAFPLPVAVIGELLGVPVQDRTQFQALVRAATVILEPMSDLEDLRRARDARVTMEQYFEGLIAERRRRPTDDLLSELIAVSDGSDRLTQDEVMSTAILLFAAGFETTTNLIGNGLCALLRHPDQLTFLRDWAHDRGRRAQGGRGTVAVGQPRPARRTGGTARPEVAGRPVADGEQVMTLLGAANRDPRRFREPDTLHLGRDEGAPLSFGSGIHYCLGAALARLEGQVCFGRLLTRFEDVELGDGGVAHRDSITLRGVTRLPVILTPT